MSRKESHDENVTKIGLELAKSAAINAKRPESAFETRLALIEAAAAVHLPQAKQIAQLGCNDANGWRLNDPFHVEVLGAACDRFKMSASSMLIANFPCEVILE